MDFYPMELDPSINATDPNPCGPEGFSVIINTQEDVDLIADCAIIKNDVIIYTNQTLSFSNLVTVEGSLTIAGTTEEEYNIYERQLEGNNQVLRGISFPRLETLDLPSLSTVKDMQLKTPNLTTWTGTKTLQSVEGLFLRQHKVSNLEFRSLTNISTIEATFDNPATVYLNGTMIDGVYGPSVRLTSFSHVSVTSDLQKTDNATFYFTGLENITLNAQIVGSLIVSNSPKKMVTLNVPYLTHVSNASNIITYGTSMEMDRQTGRISIMDNEGLHQLSFPSLISVDEDLRVLNNPFLTSFGDGFPVLESVGKDFEVKGNLTSFHLPNPVVVGMYTTIDSSNESFNCTQAMGSFPNGTIVSCSPFNYDTSKEHKPALSYSAKIGLGVGLAVFVVLFIGLGCGFCLWRSHRHPDQSGRAAPISSKLLRLWAKESFQKKPPGYPLQDLNRRDGDEPLPSYQPRVSSEQRGLGGGRRSGSERAVSPVSALSVTPPNHTQADLASQQQAPSTLPPGYRP
ncbi:hypothetical protein IFR04_008727 [Cadophora malorum]|uniref:Receptor L-domain domain-containing protein n=1 Tax=Cadophora malorum TaxID=108018 RepID=A0A8H7TE48_9HELO|nr:hypothetical protein IFR04_008727 [Cadophora malorum]